MSVHYEDDQVVLHRGDALEVASTLSDGSADCIVTSPPYYGLRDYGIDGQYGMEKTPDEYIHKLVALSTQLRRVLADDGTLWLNLGDSYPSRSDGFKRGANYNDLQPRARTRVDGEVPKSLRGLPWRVALALQADGWILRSDIIWAKPRVNGRPVGDRPMSSHEHVFLFAKQRYYHYMQVCDRDTDVWEIAPNTPANVDHVAPMPLELAQRCVMAGCKVGGTVLDPFSGSGTTGLAAQRLGRKFVGVDLNADYLDLSLSTRLRDQTLDFGEGA